MCYHVMCITVPCGGTVVATIDVGTITSPGYDLNIPYNDNQECTWNITVSIRVVRTLL